MLTDTNCFRYSGSLGHRWYRKVVGRQAVSCVFRLLRLCGVIRALARVWNSPQDCPKPSPEGPKEAFWPPNISQRCPQTAARGALGGKCPSKKLTGPQISPKCVPRRLLETLWEAIAPQRCSKRVARGVFGDPNPQYD